MLCAHTRQAWLPCAHSDCPQGTEAGAITKIIGRPGSRRAVAFVATPARLGVRLPKHLGDVAETWTWEPAKTELFAEVVLAGGRFPTPEELLRSELGLA